MNWRIEYDETLTGGPYTLKHLIEICDPENPYDVLHMVLDKCPQFLQEYYREIPNYEDGLTFIEFAYGQIKEHRKGMPLQQFMRWDICLISLKLELLDKMGRWEEYKRYFREMYALHPNYQGTYAKSAAHLTFDRASPYFMGEDEQFYYAHFLYLLLPRFEAINKVLKAEKKTKITRKRTKISDSETLERYKKMSARLSTLLGIQNNLIKRT